MSTRKRSRWFCLWTILILIGVASGAFFLLLPRIAMIGYSQHDAPLPPTAQVSLLSQGKVYVQYASSQNQATPADIQDFYTSLAVFRADTGKLLWHASNDLDLRAPIVTETTTVYTSTWTALVARDAESGREQWQTSERMVAHAAVGGVVYATSSNSSTLSAFRASDGDRLWMVPIPNESSREQNYVSQLEVGQGRVYLLTAQSFSVFQAADGKPLWSIENMPGASAFTNGNGVIYLNWQGTALLEALQASDGKVLWTFHAPRVLLNSLLTPNGVLCVNAADALYGLRVTDGKPLWSLSGNSDAEFASDNLLEANGVLYASSFHEGLLAVQVQDGKELWRFNPGGSVYSLERDDKRGVIFATISPSGPEYLASVGTNGQFLGQIPLRSAYNRQSNGVVYQWTEAGHDGYPTQIDLTSTRENDGKSLWSTHFDYEG